MDTPTPEQVAADQRLRLCAAMVELVSEAGYRAVTVRRLCARARVSADALYRLFPEGKQQCFLHVHDLAAKRTARRVAGAYAATGEHRRLTRAFEVFLEEVAREPRLAWLALVEAPGAGTAALERMEHVQSLFEAMVNAGLRADGQVAPPALIVKGMVAGIAHVVRVRLLEGREDELGGLAGPLLAWTLGCRSSAPALLLADDREISTEAVLRPGHGAGGDRARILRAAAQLAVLEGAATLTAGEIAEAAELPFHALAHEELADPCRCVLEAFELQTAEALALTLVLAHCADDWVAGIYNGMVALTRHIAHDPVFARLAFVEVYPLGSIAVDTREKLLGAFASSLWTSAPRGARVEGVAAEASIGAVWGIVHHYVLRGEAEVLPCLAGKLAYMLLSPALGAERAVEAILAVRDRGAP